jgi:hypothetical protein
MTTRKHRTTQSQIFQGTVVGIWTVIADAPVRNTRSVLEWTCKCPQGHKAQIEHAVLAYGATPTSCAACAEQARAQLAQERIREKRILKEAAKELALRTLEQMKPAAQIEGVAQPDTHTRALRIPAQPEAQESHAF